MLSTDPFIYDVLVVGAGPTGLLLACELRLGGCRVLVIEKAADPNAPSKDMPFGLRGLSVPTIESFDRRGLLDDLRDMTAARATAESTHPEQQQRRTSGHFAGIDFFYDEVDLDAWPYRLPGTIDTLAASMATIEAVLTARAEALGVEIRRGIGIDHLDRGEDGLVAVANDQRFQGRWLVGCDGGRSAVRKATGIGFTGTEPEFTGYSVQVTLADPAMLEPGRNLTAGGVYIYAPPDTIWMADFDGGASHRIDPITRAHVEAVLRKVSGTDVAVSALHQAATWTDRAYQAIDYRKGRVLLAGDAAHVHSPLGGQGLNLGLGDAMNLGWKLAAVVRGDASPDLLDSYERERRPVASQVLDRSRAQVALLRPDPGSRALEAIVRDLIETGAGATYFAERISAVGLRYDFGDTHPLVGRSAPNLRFDDGTRLNEYFREGRGVLVDLRPDRTLRAFASSYGSRINYIGSDAEDCLDLAALLVRPDGIVVWAVDSAPIEHEIASVASHWFGTP